MLWLEKKTAQLCACALESKECAMARETLKKAIMGCCYYYLHFIRKTEALPSWQTLLQSTVSSNLHPQEEGQGTAKFRRKSCIKICEF